ncbi:hypothetical protein THRCLA_00833 [Thraustotheca clavata]|uniref:Uncharacterized protein n=1 Tax=Thraustotheca clavata TaxID=74557 RepID=A0A1W0AAF1_9STRA|nr:hypothetical protein THRCLA_00833 [Thraustotheca clavata]
MMPIDVLNMAKYYGVDLRKRWYLLPLIKQAVETPLPPNWIEVEDTADDDLNDNFQSAPLYMNELSGTTQREHPADAYFRQQIENCIKEYDGRDGSAWLEFQDGTRTFYYDFATNTEQDMYPSAGLMANAQHIRIPKEVFAKAVEMHQQPKSKAIEQLDILCFHSSWKEACQGVVQTQHADIYFSISTKHFQFVLGNCEHVYTISHINGRDGKPLEAWDLRVGGKITILGRQTTLMTASMLTLQWFDHQESHLLSIKAFYRLNPSSYHDIG